MSLLADIWARQEQAEKDVEGVTTLDHPVRVILFNDEVHTFDEVIAQLIKATGCTTAKAEATAWEVHTKGKAVCFEGELSICLQVSAVLEEISLHTQIEP